MSVETTIAATPARPKKGVIGIGWSITAAVIALVGVAGAGVLFYQFVVDSKALDVAKDPFVRSSLAQNVFLELGSVAGVFYGLVLGAFVGKVFRDIGARRRR